MQEVVKKGRKVAVKAYQIMDAVDCAIDLCRDPSLSRAKRAITTVKKVVR